MGGFEVVDVGELWGEGSVHWVGLRSIWGEAVVYKVAIVPVASWYPFVWL